MVSVVVLVVVQIDYLGPDKFIDQGSTRKVSADAACADMAQTKSSLASTSLSH